MGLWGLVFSLRHGFHAWLRKPCKQSNGTMKGTVNCSASRKNSSLGQGFFKHLFSQTNHMCTCSARSPGTEGCALPWCSPSAHSSSSPAISHIAGLGGHALMPWASCHPPVSSGVFMLLRFYGFVFTTPGVHVKGKCNSCLGFCDIFVFKLKFPKRTLTLPGPEAQPNPTADDTYLMAWKETSEGCQ